MPKSFRLPEKWRGMIASDKILNTYLENLIIIGCHRSAHFRIFTDQTKFLLEQQSELLYRLQVLIKERAEEYDLDRKELYEQLIVEMDFEAQLDRVFLSLRKGLSKSIQESVHGS